MKHGSGLLTLDNSRLPQFCWMALSKKFTFSCTTQGQSSFKVNFLKNNTSNPQNVVVHCSQLSHGKFSAMGASSVKREAPIVSIWDYNLAQSDTGNWPDIGVQQPSVECQRIHKCGRNLTPGEDQEWSARRRNWVRKFFHHQTEISSIICLI